MYKVSEKLNIAQFERMLLRGDSTSLRNHGFPAAAAIASGSLESFLPGASSSIPTSSDANSEDQFNPIFLAQACLNDRAFNCEQLSTLFKALRQGSIPAAYTIITAGVALLSVFCRENWAGPPFSSTYTPDTNLESSALCLLAIDGEDVARPTRFLTALAAARELLVKPIDDLVACGARLTPWWAARVLFTHTAILSAPGPSLQRPLFSMFARFLGEQCLRSCELFDTPQWMSEQLDSELMSIQGNVIGSSNHRIAAEEDFDSDDDDDLLTMPMEEGGADIRDEEDDFGIALDKNNPVDKALMTLAYLELAIAQRTFYDAAGAEESIRFASELEGVYYRIRGEMGFRTKYQQKPTAQLIARCYKLPGDETHETIEHMWMQLSTKSVEDDCSLPLPKNVPLDDSDALGYIKLVEQEKENNDQAKSEPESRETNEDDSVMSDEEENVKLGDEVLDLTPMQQALAIGHAICVRARNASHILTKEQMAPYIDLVLRNEKSAHGCSSVVQLHALMLRVSFERERGRYLERCMSQMEEVGKFVEDKLESENALYRNRAGSERFLFVYGSGIPPRWELQKQLAISFGRIGLVKSAMEIFKKLEFWDELVDCHRLIGNLGAAETLVREQLKILNDEVSEQEETEDEKNKVMGRANFGFQKARQANSVRRPRLLCVLGDITRTREYYEQAWDESGCKYGRAQRSLARLCVEKEEWKEAVEHFREALRLNGLFPEVWFTFGCSALQINEVQLAAHAFTRVVQLTPDNGEAWNNLGRVLHEMGKGKEALKALCEAGKRKRDSWRIWKNVVQLAMEEKNIMELLNGMERILQLRGKDGVLAPPLGVAVAEVIRMSTSNSAEERAMVAYICKRLMKILAKCTSLVSGNPAIWAAYAELHELLPDDQSNMQKGFDCRLKQLRSLIVQDAWKAERQEFRHMAIVSSALLKNAKLTDNPLNVRVARQNIQSVIDQTKEDFKGDEGFERLHELLIE